MIDESTYSELDRYFHSAMNEAERSAFESKMNADKQLREEFDWLSNMLGGMKSQGRSVMKQTIASAIAGIPSGEVAKYKPSVNGKSFLKKWWWAITIVVSVLAAAVVVYSSAWIGEDGEYHFFDHDNLPYYEEEHSLTKDYATDPCFDEGLPPTAVDSMKDSSDTKGGAATIDENADVLYEGQVKPVYVRDSAPNVDYFILSEVLPQKGHRIENMPTQINKRSSPPYTYELTDRLKLNANYTTTAGFVFNGSGDTVYMTDNSSQTFMLLKGKGEQPLTPMRVGGNK